MKMKNILTVPFNFDNYNTFAREFFNGIDKIAFKEIKPNATFASTIDYYVVHGTYEDPEGNEIVVLSVKVKENSSARQAQRNFVSHLLSNEYNQFSAAMVAYFDDIRTNWKLSFVTVEMALGEKGIELKFKPAKRYSFLVGKDEPTKTYVQQLSTIYESTENPTLDEISDAFSVSKLSKDFYEDYKNKFFELYDYLESNKQFQKECMKIGYIDEDGLKKFTTTFCKKTLGQIMFLYFVQKKGWLGVVDEWGDGDKRYLSNSIKAFTGTNYFDEFLEPLFYNALNCKRDNDLYLDKKIPFLNGGLFQPIENYNWEDTNFDIPNDYWFNDSETGLIDILSQYNFTVDESSPDEQEVAIDPEMLGKIFESLLDTNDRSALGAFYTPREIVRYMCEESLAERISKILKLDVESILNFIRYGDALKETDFIKGFADEIDEFVSTLTIVDPAVGSGAFLVGMLNSIVKLRTSLNEISGKRKSIYDIKLETIQNSLYGVDVEYDAVEIAKLRLWLSLIVDQETFGKAPKPLPNLNFHLRVGNSLVDTYEGIKLWNVRWRGSKKEAKFNPQINLFNTETVETILFRLKEAKVKFFSTSDEKEKQKLSRQIETEQLELIKSELIAQGRYELFYQIEEMIKKKTKPFFIWDLEFEEVYKNGKGFDIVVANPPYVQLQKNGGKLADELKDQGYESFTRMGDIYCLFYEKAINLLKDEGVFCFITSNKWMRAGYGEKLRGYLAKNCNPIKLIDFGGNKVFESATVDVNIMLATKENNKGETRAVTVDDELCANNLSDYFTQNYTINNFNSENNWILLNKIELSIRNKIEKSGTPLSMWNIQINYGIKTGYNEAFIINESTKDALINADPKSAELIRPILRGKDIKRYTYNFAEKYLICTFPSKHYDIDKFPAVRDYLLSFDKRRLDQSGEKNIDGIKGFNSRKKTNNMWFETQDQINYSDDFDDQIIAWQRITKENTFCLTNPGMVVLDSMAFIAGAADYTYYLLAVLNSNLIKFWMKKNVPEYGSTGYRFSNQFVTQIPIPAIIDEELLSMINKEVKNILDDTANFNLLNKINYIIYKIYQLSENEIKYIENGEYLH